MQLLFILLLLPSAFSLPIPTPHHTSTAIFADFAPFISRDIVKAIPINTIPTLLASHVSVVKSLTTGPTAVQNLRSIIKGKSSRRAKRELSSLVDVVVRSLVDRDEIRVL